MNYNNTGIENQGDSNSGNRNIGNMNSGSRNIGDCNSGNSNKGCRNSGDCNLGDYNAGNFNRACNAFINSFCTKGKHYLFNKECSKEEHNEIYKIDFLWFKLTESMDYQEAWDKCPKEILEQIKKLKNFDPEIFFIITGIKI